MRTLMFLTGMLALAACFSEETAVLPGEVPAEFYSAPRSIRDIPCTHDAVGVTLVDELGDLRVCTPFNPLGTQYKRNDHRWIRQSPIFDAQRRTCRDQCTYFCGENHHP